MRSPSCWEPRRSCSSPSIPSPSGSPTGRSSCWASPSSGARWSAGRRSRDHCRSRRSCFTRGACCGPSATTRSTRTRTRRTMPAVGPQVDGAQVRRRNAALARRVLCRRRRAVGIGGRSGRRGRRVLDRAWACCASARLAGGDARHRGYAQLPCPLQVQSARGLGTVPGACGRHGPRRARFRPLRRQSAQRLRRGRRSERAAIPACRCIAARPRPSLLTPEPSVRAALQRTLPQKASDTLKQESK